jgi:AAA+ ATPase superfamily predicted ATPase
MPPGPFVAREPELHQLQEEWEAPAARLLILYGRRRVGKTRLITHWMELSGARVLYWVADPTSATEQLRSFSQALYNFENRQPAPEAFTYATWAQALQQVARLAQNERLGIVLDEFTYLLASDPSIAGILQNAWDHSLSRTRLFLILSGSHIGMMQRELLAYQAPLYGRATARLRLAPLPFGATRAFFRRYRADERVAVYAMLGGVPGYWEMFDPATRLDQNIRQQLLGRSGLMMDEPRLLLQDFVSDIHNYVAILRAIAHGYRTPKPIADRAGLNERHISMYLQTLIATGYVERRLPVTAPPSSRLGRHYITDPFLRFYFRFLSERQAQLALGVQEQALAELKKQLVDFIGTYTWEGICRDWLLRAGAHGHLPFLPDQVGSAWTRTAQVDVVGVNHMEKTLVLGECKWGRRACDQDVLEKLAGQAAEFVPQDGHWRVLNLGFSRSGWTDAARQFARDFATQAPQEHVRIIGMELLDLKRVDDDLAAWE